MSDHLHFPPGSGVTAAITQFVVYIKYKNLVQPRWHTRMHALLRGSATNVASSSGDTIPNCLGKFREIKERTGITAYGHPAGTPEQTGVKRRIYTPHSLRATTATLLLDAGADIIKVKELLGHNHVTTTQIYDKRRRSLKEGASHDVPI